MGPVDGRVQFQDGLTRFTGIQAHDVRIKAEIGQMTGEFGGSLGSDAGSGREIGRYDQNRLSHRV